MYTAYQTLERCLNKAITAKSNQKLEIAKALIKRAFTPITNLNKLRNGRSPWGTVRSLLFRASVDKDGTPEYKVLVKEVTSAFVDQSFDRCDPYCYIFTRQDIRPEAQLVQTAHCTMVMGAQIKTHQPGIDPRRINFVCMGAKDLTDLKQKMNYMADRGIRYEMFIEPDINNEATAICTYPITSIAERKKFGRFKLLKFERPIVKEASKSSERPELLGA